MIIFKKLKINSKSVDKFFNFDQLQLGKLAQQSAHQTKYDGEVFGADIALEKSGLYNASTLIQATDPSSTGAFDASIGRIRNKFLRYGMKIHSVVPDENGNDIYIGDDGKPMKVRVNPQTQVEMAKEISGGLYDTISNLNAAGYPDKAELLHKKYEDQIDGFNKIKLAKEFETTTLDNTAQLMSEVGVGSTEYNRLLDVTNDPARRSKLKDKALEISNSRMTKREQIKDRTEKVYYGQAYEAMKTRMSGPDPFVPGEAERDPIIKALLPKMNPKDQEVILSMANEGPKTSSPEGKLKFQNLLLNQDPDFPNGLRHMAPEVFAKYVAPLSKEERVKAQTKYEAMNSETGAQQQERYGTAAKELEQQLRGNGYLVPDSFNRITGDELNVLNGAKAKLVEALDTYGAGPMSPKERTTFVSGVADALAKNKAFVLPERKRFQGTVVAKADAPKTAPPATSQIPLGDSKKWVDKFVKTYHRGPNLMLDELNKFIAQETAK